MWIGTGISVSRPGGGSGEAPPAAGTISTVNAAPTRTTAQAAEPTITGALAPVGTQKDGIFAWKHSLSTDLILPSGFTQFFAVNNSGSRLLFYGKFVESDGEVMPDEAGESGRRMGATLLRFSNARASILDHVIPVSGEYGGTPDVDSVYALASRITSSGGASGSAGIHDGLTLTGTSIVWPAHPGVVAGSVVLGFAHTSTNVELLPHSGLDRWTAEGSATNRTAVGERSPSSAAFNREQLEMSTTALKITAVAAIRP